MRNFIRVALSAQRGQVAAGSLAAGVALGLLLAQLLSPGVSCFDGQALMASQTYGVTLVGDISVCGRGLSFSTVAGPSSRAVY